MAVSNRLGRQAQRRERPQQPPAHGRHTTGGDHGHDPADDGQGQEEAALGGGLFRNDAGLCPDDLRLQRCDLVARRQSVWAGQRDIGLHDPRAVEVSQSRRRELWPSYPGEPRLKRRLLRREKARHVWVAADQRSDPGLLPGHMGYRPPERSDGRRPSGGYVVAQRIRLRVVPGEQRAGCLGGGYQPLGQLLVVGLRTGAGGQRESQRDGRHGQRYSRHDGRPSAQAGRCGHRVPPITPPGPGKSAINT